MHPRLRPLFDLAGVLVEIAEAAGGTIASAAAHRRRDGRYCARKAGPGTPMWNACAKMLATELRRKNAKVLLARYLGLPKQRITDFVVTRTRIPDAELTLQLLVWLTEKRAGRDPTQQIGSLNTPPPARPSRR